MLQINNTCELILGGEQSEKLYLTSRGKNQFFEKRELCRGRTQLAMLGTPTHST